MNPQKQYSVHQVQQIGHSIGIISLILRQAKIRELVNCEEIFAEFDKKCYLLILQIAWLNLPYAFNWRRGKRGDALGGIQLIALAGDAALVGIPVK